METIERNPDIDLDKQDVPKGMTLIEGKLLMHTARSRKIPFGVATAINRSRGYERRETVGLIIRNGDVAGFHAPRPAKNSRAKKPTGGTP